MGADPGELSKSSYQKFVAVSSAKRPRDVFEMVLTSVKARRLFGKLVNTAAAVNRNVRNTSKEAKWRVIAPRLIPSAKTARSVYTTSGQKVCKIACPRVWRNTICFVRNSMIRARANANIGRLCQSHLCF